MSTDKTRLEIAHVLFIDIVGYSKLLVKQQSELLGELNEVVSETSEFREAESAGKLIRLPTGDGMALVFRTNPEAPAQCAMEIARQLKSHPAIQLRMGIHSGPVNEVVDVNQRANIAGDGAPGRRGAVASIFSNDSPMCDLESSNLAPQSSELFLYRPPPSQAVDTADETRRLPPTKTLRQIA